MKKFLQITLVLVVSLCYIANVNAASEDDLINYATKYGTTEQVNLVKSYLADNDVSDEVGDQLIQKADKIRSIMETAGVDDPTKLNDAQKNEVRSIVTEAAALLNATYDYNPTTERVTITGPNGKVYGSIPIVPSAKLASTGSDYTVYVAISGLAIALAGVAIRRKLKGNA